MKKIAFIGPESSGKSELSKFLAEKHNSPWIDEYARKYLTELKRPYQIDDLDVIAKNQAAQIEKIDSNYEFCFIDTELITLKIWSEFKYNKYSPLILHLLEEQKIDLYFLCSPDIPWTPDPLRETPNDREELFKIYEKELQARNYNYAIVSGDLKTRVQFVENIIF